MVYMEKILLQRVTGIYSAGCPYKTNNHGDTMAYLYIYNQESDSWVIHRQLMTIRYATVVRCLNKKMTINQWIEWGSMRI